MIFWMDWTKSREQKWQRTCHCWKRGPNLKRPYADVVRGKIRELRIRQSSNHYRILFFFQARDQIVLAHAFSKKTQQLKESDIELAERRMEDWIRRLMIGGIK